MSERTTPAPQGKTIDVPQPKVDATAAKPVPGIAAISDQDGIADVSLDCSGSTGQTSVLWSIYTPRLNDTDVATTVLDDETSETPTLDIKTVSMDQWAGVWLAGVATTNAAGTTYAWATFRVGDAIGRVKMDLTTFSLTASPNAYLSSITAAGFDVDGDQDEGAALTNPTVANADWLNSPQFIAPTGAFEVKVWLDVVQGNDQKGTAILAGIANGTDMTTDRYSCLNLEYRVSTTNITHRILLDGFPTYGGWASAKASWGAGIVWHVETDDHDTLNWFDTWSLGVAGALRPSASHQAKDNLAWVVTAGALYVVVGAYVWQRGAGNQGTHTMSAPVWVRADPIL